MAIELWARVYLLSIGCLFAVVYALPLLLVPMRWARWFKWDTDGADGPVSIYFARCLGAVALAIIVLSFNAARDPRAHRDLFDLCAIAAGMLGLVHLHGAVQRTQPWTEDAEIVLYGAACAAAIYLRVHL